MRVAVISDIHGNLPALEAVLAEIRRQGADRVVMGGDAVPGPLCREVIEALLDFPVPVSFIPGNGENDLLALSRGEALARVPKQFHEVMHWTLERMPPEFLERMADWPATLRMDIGGIGDVLFCHATPRDDNELFTKLTPEDRLRPIFAVTGADLVTCGHTHMQFDRMIGNVRVINQGSVGMPFGEPGACWAMLGPEVALRRTDYDYAAAATLMDDTAFPDIGRIDPVSPPPEAQMLELFEAAALNQEE